jgi:hypothetical protein
VASLRGDIQPKPTALQQPPARGATVNDAPPRAARIALRGGVFLKSAVPLHDKGPIHEHVGAVLQSPLLPSSKSALRSDGPSGQAAALRNRVWLGSASFSLRPRELGSGLQRDRVPCSDAGPNIQIACILRHANPTRAATALSPTLARVKQSRPLRARRRKMPALWPTTSRPPPLPSGRALVRRTSGDMAGSPRTPCPLARSCGGNSISDHARRARSSAPGQ